MTRLHGFVVRVIVDDLAGIQHSDVDRSSVWCEVHCCAIPEQIGDGPHVPRWRAATVGDHGWSTWRDTSKARSTI